MTKLVTWPSISQRDESCDLISEISSRKEVFAMANQMELCRRASSPEAISEASTEASTAELPRSASLEHEVSSGSLELLKFIHKALADTEHVISACTYVCQSQEDGRNRNHTLDGRNKESHVTLALPHHADSSCLQARMSKPLRASVMLKIPGRLVGLKDHTMHHDDITTNDDSVGVQISREQSQSVHSAPRAASSERRVEAGTRRVEVRAADLLNTPPPRPCAASWQQFADEVAEGASGAAGSSAAAHVDAAAAASSRVDPRYLLMTPLKQICMFGQRHAMTCS